MSFINSILPKFSRPDADANGANQPEFTLKPAYRIVQTAEAWTLMAQLPGVTKDGLEVTAEDGVISIQGRRQWQQPEGWTPLYREPYDRPRRFYFPGSPTPGSLRVTRLAGGDDKTGYFASGLRACGISTEAT